MVCGFKIIKDKLQEPNLSVGDKNNFKNPKQEIRNSRQNATTNDNP